MGPATHRPRLGAAVHRAALGIGAVGAVLVAIPVRQVPVSRVRAVQVRLGRIVAVRAAMAARPAMVKRVARASRVANEAGDRPANEAARIPAVRPVRVRVRAIGDRQGKVATVAEGSAPGVIAAGNRIAELPVLQKWRPHRLWPGWTARSNWRRRQLHRPTGVGHSCSALLRARHSVP